MDKYDVAAVLYEIADLLDIQGVAFKPVAYRRAARNIEQLEEDINAVAREGRLKDIPGVGDAMSKKILELVETGRLRYLEELRGQVPAGLVDLLKVPDVGPKTAMILYKELGITSVEQLKQAVLDHRLHGIKGFGEKTEEKILQGIRTMESKGGRTLLGEALPLAEAYVDHLTSSAAIDLISIGGSLRRGKETVGDIDILVGDDNPAEVLNAFVRHPDVSEILMKGPTKASVRMGSGLQVDMRAVETKSYGAALQYFTGSKEHNVELRRIGVEKGLKLNEYGLFGRENGEMVAGRTEEDVYRALGLSWIPPELRENTGEIEAAREGRLPKLVEQGEIRGDMHVHSNWSDGGDSLEDIVKYALSKSYGFVAITDHSQSLKIANGLSPEKLRKQIDQVRKLKDSYEGRITVLAGSEVDIKGDGTLDFPDDLLRDLDVVIGSVHSRFKMDRDSMTKRVVSAIDSGRIHILGHPTARLIGQRPSYEIDLGRVFEAAASAGVAMEVNSFPDRLDLNDSNCRLAKGMGVRIAIGTDAHSVDQMDFMRLGVITTRRGWLEAGDLLNTMSGKALAEYLNRRTA